MSNEIKQAKRPRPPATRPSGGGVYVNGERVAGTIEAPTHADPTRLAERAARTATPRAATKESDNG